MMNALRKHTKTILWFVVIAFVGTIFFVWGMDLGRRKDSLDLQSAAVVNGDPVSYETFGQAWEQRYRQVFADSVEEPAPQEVQRLRNDLIGSLIDNLLISQAADQLGLSVLPEEIAARIYSISAFQHEGQFSREKYISLLGYSRITPEAFEAEQAQSIKMAKMQQYLRDSVLVTEAEIQAYHQARGRQLKLQVIGFDWETYLPGLNIPSQRVEDYYQAHREEYDQPEEVQASHILIRVNANATEEEKLTAKLKLENVKSEIDKGKSFSEMAKEYSDDPGSATQGGDLGYFRRGAMVPPFEEAAFALKPGGLSEVVETAFGFHLIKVTGRREAKKSTLAGVRTKILTILKEQEAKRLAQKAATDFLKLLQENEDLSTAAQQSKLKYRTTPWLQEGDAIPRIKDSERIVDQAFDLTLNRPSGSLFSGTGIYFVQITSEKFKSFNEKLYAMEYESTRERLKTQRGNQAVRDWLSQTRSRATITNNIEKEGSAAEEELPADQDGQEASTPEQSAP